MCIIIALYSMSSHGCKTGIDSNVPAEGKSRRSALMAWVSSSSCWLPASLTFRHLHSQSLESDMHLVGTDRTDST